jgi:hypothetical protein
MPPIGILMLEQEHISFHRAAVVGMDFARSGMLVDAS